MTDLLGTIAADAPPPGLSEAKQALWWLAKGNYLTGAEWERAHEICQAHEGERDHDLIHALTHLIEGDTWNSDYWYRRAGVARTSSDPACEWAAVVDAVA